MIFSFFEPFGILVVVGLLLARVAEHRLHSSNYQFLVEAGGNEVGSKTMSLFYLLQNFLVILVLCESFWKFHSLSNKFHLVGLLLVLFSLFVRVWAFNSMGRYWSKRCIFIKGAPRVESGPYRYIMHPEYISRFMEFIGLALVFDAVYSFIIGLVLMSITFRLVIRMEQEHLAGLSTSLLESLRQYKLSKLDQSISLK